MKTVLAIWHLADKGKTETLREFANLLMATYPSYIPVDPIPPTVSPDKDFRLIVKVNGKNIGIESQGDPNTNLQHRLIELADKFQCEIILCSSRTKGETVVAVDNLHRTRNFQTIWTSTYQIDGRTNQNLANNLKAKHILDLLQGLKLI